MLRIMDGSSYNVHTAPIMLQYQILPYELLIKQSQLSFMHSIEYKYAPNSFDNVWQKNSERHPELNLRNVNDYYLLQPKTETLKKSPIYVRSLLCGMLFHP
jgi:hypothetical protein